MNLRNINIGLRLLIGFGIQIALIILIGTLSLNEIGKTTKTFDEMYQHPFTVLNTAREINTKIVSMHRSMKDLALAENQFQMELAINKVNKLESEVHDLFNVIFDRYLGDQKDVQLVYQEFIDWRPIRLEVIELWYQKKSTEAIAITKGKGADHVEKLNQQVKTLIKFASQKAKNLEENVKSHERRVYLGFLILLLIAIFISIMVILLFTQSIISPINAMNDVSKKIQNGDLKIRNKIRYNDELSQLAVGFNLMTDSIESRNNIQQKIGDIYNSILDFENIDKYCKSITRTLEKITEANCVAFYKLNNDQDSFVHITSIGCNQKIKASLLAILPEGEMDKLIENRQIQHNKYPNLKPQSYSSILSSHPIQESITLPIVADDKVIAIVCLASISTFSATSIEALKQAWILLNTSYSNIISNELTVKLAEDLTQSNQQLESQWQKLQNQSTELQEQNIELEMQRNQVEESNRLKSEFLSNMSHELRTPLNSILALSKVLIMQANTKLDDDENSYLEIIERNGRNLLNLINDILDLSKVEAGKMELSPLKFSIRTSLENTIESLASIAKNKNIELKLNLPPSNITIETDEKRLQQIIINILANAIKFTEKGSVTITAFAENSVIKIQITDTGIGIPKEKISTIFEEFRQIDGSTSRSFEGTGLGLAITLKLVNALYGKIEAESELGIGSKFTVTLPQNWPNSSENKPHLGIDKQQINSYKKTILVIDDDINSGIKIENHLKTSGYKTIRTTSGKEALNIAEIQQPFAITLDIIMPEMDGFEVLQNLKANIKTKDIPVIIVSVSNETQTGFALGAVGFVQKPIQKHDLMDAIYDLSISPKNIMIVDDSEIDRLHYKQLFSDTDINTQILSNGQACLDELNNSIPNLLILDLMMPDMDGFQVLNSIRNNPKTSNLPVIVVTAKELTNQDRNILSQKNANILSKSDLDTENLILNVKKAISIAEKNNHAKKEILIIEDNEIAIIQIKKVLQNHQFNVSFAKNGIDALKYLERNQPNAIILDLMMPQMDGFEFLEKLKQNTLPILVLTAKSLTTDELAKLSDHNIQFLVQKGDIDTDGLIDKVSSMTNKHHIHTPTIKIVNPTSSIKENRKLILLIEDNKDNRVTVKAILNKDYTIIEAIDGEEGLKLANLHLPDLILCDIALPGLDGFQVVKKLKTTKTTIDIPTIALTAKAMKNDKEIILKSGFNAYISKPIDILELKETIILMLKK